MNASPRWALALALALAACGDEPGGACSGTEAVQLLRSEPFGTFDVARSGAYTFVRGVDELGHIELYAGADCGAEPTRIRGGVGLRPFPSEWDDPTLACDLASSHFFRIDPDGEAEPSVLLPDLLCLPTLRSEHGIVLFGRQDRRLWLYPDFPEQASARLISDQLDFGTHATLRLLGDDLHYLVGGELRVHDLASGADHRLLTDVAAYDVTPTHVLWREITGSTVAPVRLLDRTSGARTYLGLYHEHDDEGVVGRPSRITAGDPWSFNRDGDFVMHIPIASDAPMAAFDLEGRPLEFPAWGLPRYLLDDGTTILAIDREHFAVRPGAPPVALDIPIRDIAYDRLRVIDDHLERLDAGELYHVPLDGSPSRLLARGVGQRWSWLDDDHLLTLDTGVLSTIQPATAHRTELARSVIDYKFVSEDGLYFQVSIAPSAPQNGVWFLPEAGLRPPPPRCVNFDVCM